jgi:hypothetical protein
VERQENATGVTGKGYEMTHPTSSITRRKRMLRKLKTIGYALAVIGMASTLAVAVEMTCIQDDGKGTCTGGQAADSGHIVVVGKGVKKGEKMDCVDKGNMIDCKPMQQMQKKP